MVEYSGWFSTRAHTKVVLQLSITKHKFCLSLVFAKFGNILFFLNAKVRFSLVTKGVNRFQVIYTRSINELDALIKRVKCSDPKLSKSTCSKPNH